VQHVVAPLPDEPYASSPGRALASAISSCVELAGNDGCTTSRNGTVATSMMGSKSFTGSNGTFAYKVGLTAWAALMVKSSV